MTGSGEKEVVSNPWPYGEFAKDFNKRFDDFGLHEIQESIHFNLDLTVQFAILARNASPFLPLFLESVLKFEFPKKSIILDFLTNNNSDDTSVLVQKWIENHGNEYNQVFFTDDSYEKLNNDKTLTWSDSHFTVIKEIRNRSLARAIQNEVDFLFVCDVDVFLLPETLRCLVELNLPIVSPLIRFDTSTNIESNFAATLNANGWPLWKSHLYGPIVSQTIRGIIEVPLVHCCYLIRKDVLEKVTYSNLHSSTLHEFITFAENARKAKVSMYLDNRQLYGCGTMKEPGNSQLQTFIETTKSKLSRSW